MLEACDPKLLFREVVLRSNAGLYVAREMADDPECFAVVGIPSIFVAIRAEKTPVDPFGHFYRADRTQIVFLSSH